MLSFQFRFSLRMITVQASPPSPQAWQLTRPLSRLTDMDGSSSEWKTHLAMPLWLT